MVRDSQAALVALHRFGFGARGGASGDLVNAASDPRGFVKAELSRPTGVLMEVPGLHTTPALAAGVFAYQLEFKRARAAAAKSSAPTSEATPPKPPTVAKPQARNLSLNQVAMDIAGQDAPVKAPENNNAAMQSADPMQSGAMQPNAAQPNAANQPQQPPQPLNGLQKTYRAEALARLQRAVLPACGVSELLEPFWSNPFCISTNKVVLPRIWAGSFEREAIRPFVLGRFGDM